MRKASAYAIYVANLIIVIIFWRVSSGPLMFEDLGGTLLALARLVGLLAASSALTQLVLIGRLQWVEERIGMDQLTRIHHQNGFVVMSLVVMHPILVTLAYAVPYGISFPSQFLDLLRYWDYVRLAAIGILVFATVFTTATALRKRLTYEQWYYTHVFAYAAIGLTSVHQFSAGGDFRANAPFRAYWIVLYSVSVGTLVFFRFARPLYYYWRHRFVVQRIVKETDDVASLYIAGRNLARFPIRAGQFMILRFLSNRLWWQAHPFSLSCLPNKDHIRVSVKNVGDFTSQVPTVLPGTPVLIDGPHGAFTARMSSQEKILMIGGGIGITPLLSLIEQFMLETRDVILLCANRSGNDIVFQDELGVLAQNGQLVIHHVLSRDPAWTGEKGHIDQEKLRRLVPDLLERDVFLCGPVPMMLGVTMAVRELGLSRSRIHFERFAL